jgi:hypothetical protein
MSPQGQGCDQKQAGRVTNIRSANAALSRVLVFFKAVVSFFVLLLQVNHGIWRAALRPHPPARPTDIVLGGLTTRS